MGLFCVIVGANSAGGIEEVRCAGRLLYVHLLMLQNLLVKALLQLVRGLLLLE